MTRRQRRVGLLLAATVAAGVAVAGTSVAADDLAVVEQDLSAHPAVTLVLAGPSLATDADLPAEAFAVVEHGRRLDVAVERLDQRLDVVLAIDTSGSMQGEALAAARSAAAAFVDRLRPDTSVAILGFGPTASVVLPFTTDRDVARAALATMTPAGETALYDAVVVAAGLFEGSTGRRAVVLLSDGGDTASAVSSDVARSSIGSADTALWAVSLSTPESDRAALDRLVDGTGGRVVRAEDPAALDDAFRAVTGDLAGRYRLTYRSDSHGPTDVVVSVAGSSVTTRLAYPAATASGGSTTAAPPIARSQPLEPRRGDGRLLAIGAAALFASMALALGLLLAGGTPVRLAARRAPEERGLWRRISALADRATAAAEHGLERRGHRRGVEAMLEQAGINLRAGEALVVLATAWFTGGALAGLVGGPLLAPVGAVATALAGVGIVLVLRSRRRAGFGEQVEDVLQLLGGSLRAGYGLVQAVDLAARELPAPAGDELRRVTTEVRLGRDLADALEGAADRTGHEDFRWAVQAIRIHREVGGDLASVLDRVAETVRARAHLRRQVAALSAEGRVSALILGLLPPGLLAVMALLNPGYLSDLVGNRTGVALLATAGALMAAGVVWLRHIARPVY
ncbi:MAG TPA: type II secretion system F family protein [Acidimicrobiales bacterium]|nr:type II secretion system F family protein [Acidimicrobiales bacterium]